MTNQKILYVSGSVGMGHVTRDLAIVRELRNRNKGVEVVWLADPPVTDYLRQANERVLPDLEKISGKGSNEYCDSFSSDYRLNLNQMFLSWMKSFPERVRAINEVAEREKVDLIVGDETYDIMSEYVQHPELKKRPFLLILDFIGARASGNIKYMLPCRIFNKWNLEHIKRAQGKEGTLFIGEIEDIVPDKLGLFLPKKRDLAEKMMNCVGYSIDFDPSKMPGKAEMKTNLGLGQDPLILVTVGGSGVGTPLLKKAAEAFPMMKSSNSNLKMLVVAGPRIPVDSIPRSEGMEVKGMVPELYRYMTAADLVISSGGGTTTLELQALNKPFIYFPIEDHFEQEVDVAYHLEQNKVGIRMAYSKTTPERLAEVVLQNVGKEVKYPPVRLDGARLAAEYIDGLLSKIDRGELGKIEPR